MTIPLAVGVDGSEASLEAVDWAAAEAARHGIPLHLLHAAAGEQEASHVIGAAVARAQRCAPAVRLSSEVSHEDAATALVVKGRNAFALVLASRGVGGLAGMLLGSVSLAVTASADCPVVVVRGSPQHRAAQFGNVVVGIEDGEASGTAVDFALREADVRGCRLTAVHAWGAPSGACTTPQAPSWLLEAHRRPPAHVHHFGRHRSQRLFECCDAADSGHLDPQLVITPLTTAQGRLKRLSGAQSVVWGW
ncbi:universal stress protein [Streptomyces sp. NPDC001761]